MMARTDDSGGGRGRVDILRPRTANPLLDLRSFETGFVFGVGQHVRIEVCDAGNWPRTLFVGGGRERAAARSLAERCAHADFLCPGAGPLAWSPELLRLRNLAGSPVRALLIAHAPGVFLPEWALLAPLLGPGDRIIAPSERAAAVISMLCPELSPFVRVIPYPIPPWLDADAAANRPRYEPPRLVGLGRMIREKLIHRQIEALAILRQRGLWVRLDLAGPMNEPGIEGPSAYVRSLRAKIERLNLGSQVRLHGPIEVANSKLAFVRDAAAMINLSVNLEESFGKAIAEGLSCGVPSLCTRWGGLDETGGAGSLALPVSFHDYDADVSAEMIADGVQAIVADPPDSSLCHRLSRRFDPQQVAARYREVLDEARQEFAAAGRPRVDEPEVDLPAAPDSGLLARTAPLTVMSWSEAMALHGQEMRNVADPLGADGPARMCAGAQLRGVLGLAARPAVQRMQAGLALEGSAAESMVGGMIMFDSRRRAESGPFDFLERCAESVVSPGSRASRVIVADLLQRLGRHHAVEQGLARLRVEGQQSKGMRYVEIESRLRAGAPDQALVLCEREFGDHLELGEHQAYRLSQYARACHQLRQPGRALPALRRWTDRFPDGPEAAGLWQQRALLALLAEGARDEARMGLGRCITLQGPLPELLSMLEAVDELAPSGSAAAMVE
ncbi:MAG: glycosyltransferase [Myxococcales bacterium]|nr:glycosyltransferase [Myxococcales bacterium]